MNDHLHPQTVTAVRALYEQNPDARRLFDWIASLRQDATATSIDRMVVVLRISRNAAVSLARELQDADCGEFIIGRRGSPSRFKWAYSRVSLGQVASGETEEIEEPYDPISETEEEDAEPQGSARRLTIQAAKILLAESLGLEPSQIGIEIRA